MTVNLTPALEHDLEQLAIERNSTPSILAQQAVEGFIAYQQRILSAVEEGRAAADRGDMLDHDEVMSMMDEIIQHG